MFQFGRKIKCQKEEYIILQYYQDGYYLGVKPNATIPAQIYLIKDDDDKKEEI